MIIPEVTGRLDLIPSNQLYNSKHKYDHVHVDIYRPNEGRNTTLSWFPPDLQRTFEHNIKDEKSYKLLELNGWIDTEIQYHINKQGFRHDGSTPDLLSTTGGVIYVGDSTTFGVGNRLEDTWTYTAHAECAYTKHLRYINFGCPGYGIDTYYRLLKYYIKDIKPDYVILCMPWIMTRSEKWDTRRWKSVNVHIEDLTDKDIDQLFTPAPSFMRWYKNLDAIKWICHSVGAKFYAIEEETERTTDWLKNKTRQILQRPITPTDYGRDLAHHGVATHHHNSIILREIIDRVHEDGIL